MTLGRSFRYNSSAEIALENSQASHQNFFRSIISYPQIPAYLSVALLAYQIALIWWFGGFPTQDGPSHLYNAVLLREVLFQSESPYHRVYTLNHHLVPNWTSPILLSIGNLLVGSRHVEQALATMMLVFLYSAMAYAQRALAPHQSLLWPGMNALLNVWFLYMGFYNFYLGVALGVFCVGYYIKHRQHIVAKHYVWLGMLIILLYFTHPMAQALSCVVLSIACLWDQFTRTSREPQQQARARASTMQGLVRSYGLLLVSMTPGILLLLNFVFRQQKAAHGPFALSWKELGARLLFFPLELFTIHHSGFPALLNYAVCMLVISSTLAGIVRWKRSNWLSAQGGIFLSMAVMFGMYLTAPAGWVVGGWFLKLRLAWMILLFGAIVAFGYSGSRILLAVSSVFLFPFVVAQLIVTAMSIPQLNRAVGYYQQLEPRVRTGSSLLCLMYSADQFEEKYGLGAIRYDPLLHAVDTIALRKHCLNWSNYEATSDTFPVIFRTTHDENRSVGREFERKDRPKANQLQSFLAQTGGQLDYVIVYGEFDAREELPRQGEDAQIEADFRSVLALLSEKYDLIATAGNDRVLRLYRRKPGL